MNNYTAAKIKKRREYKKKIRNKKIFFVSSTPTHKNDQIFVSNTPTHKNDQIFEIYNDQKTEWISLEYVENMNKRTYSEDFMMNTLLGEPWKPKKTLKLRILNFLMRRI